MIKPWFKSTAILGGITTAIGIVADPRALDVLSVLPMPETARSKVSAVITAIGVFAGIFGIRRAIPDATIMQTSSGAVAVHDPSGVLIKDLTSPRNEFGETPAQQQLREAIMAKKGEELRASLEAQGR